MNAFQEMIHSDKPVLADFFATWCGPCKTMSPILAQVKQLLGDAITIIKIDVDKNPQAASAYNVHGVPTIILFKNGKVLWRQSGVVQASALVNLIKQYEAQ